MTTSSTTASTIVMTGGTSGLGAVAAGRLAATPGTRLILGARRAPAVGEHLPLDLVRLDSVRTFAAAVHDRRGERGIDAVVLNAGIIAPHADGRTAEGVETTFAVNHLAPYLLLRLLLPALRDGARIVLTTSGTHDPAVGAGLVPPRHADAALLSRPDLDPDLDPRPARAGQHAYTASKLCTVLTARQLAGVLDARPRRSTVVAYDPGQVFGTGLVANLSRPVRAAWALLGVPVLARPLGLLDRHRHTRAVAGRALADLAAGRAVPPGGRVYAALRRGRLEWPDPSELARRDDLARALWRDSADLVAVPA